MAVDLSIIIVNWNTRQLLAECLQAVMKTVSGVEFEVIVVDNGSTDGSQEMLKDAFPQVSLIQNSENAGFARANNQGMRQCQGRQVLLLNSDAFLTGDAVAKMLAVFAQEQTVGIAGAHLFYPDGRHQDSHGPLPSITSEILSLAGMDRVLSAAASWNRPGSGIVPTGTVSGACFMARREMLDQIGLFDEDFFFFSEEVDLCLRAQQAGWQVVYLPETRVLHIQGGSTGPTAQRLLQLYRAKLQYFAKHQGQPASRKLFRAMQLTCQLKALSYRLLQALHLKNGDRASVWLAVAQNLPQVMTG